MMKPIRIAKAIFSFLAVGSASLFLAACYGSPIMSRFFVARVRDKATHEPVKGLKLTLRSSQGESLFEARSREDGSGNLCFDPKRLGEAGYAPFAVVATDDDGTQNGGPYREASVATDGSDESVLIDVEE